MSAEDLQRYERQHRLITEMCGVYDANGEPAKCLAILERVLKIRRASLSPDHPSVAATLYNMAGAHMQLGDLDAAREALERAVEIREKAHEPHHFETGNTLHRLAVVALDQRRPGEALELGQRALEIARGNGRDQRLAQAQAVTARAIVATDARERFDEAVAMAREAAAFFREAGEKRRDELEEVESWLRAQGVSEEP